MRKNIFGFVIVAVDRVRKKKNQKKYVYGSI